MDQMELRTSLTQAGITESVCDIVEKYCVDGQVEEQVEAQVEVQSQAESQAEQFQQAVVEQQMVESTEQQEEAPVEAPVEELHLLQGTDLRRSLGQAGITESVCDIVEKYTTGGEVQQQVEVTQESQSVQQSVVVEGHVQLEVQEGGNFLAMTSTELRKSLDVAGITESVVDIVVKYVETAEEEEPQQQQIGDDLRLRLSQEQFDNHSTQAQEVVREYLVKEEVVVAEEEQEVQVEQTESPGRLRLTKEEFERHSGPAKDVVREYVVVVDEPVEEVTVDETHETESHVTEEQQTDGQEECGRFTLTKQQYEQHSDQAKEVVKEYVVVGEEQLQESEMNEEQIAQAKAEGRWGRCSEPAQKILEGYEASPQK